MRRSSWLGLLVFLTFFVVTLHAEEPVFLAHYILVNQDYQADDDPTQENKISSYQREIRQAQAMGIDGFALNVGGWLRHPYYIRYAAQMFEAAARLKNGFKLVFSADMCCGNDLDDLEDMMRRFANNPRYRAVYLRHEHKFVLTTFGGDKHGPAFWQKLRNDFYLSWMSPNFPRRAWVPSR